MGLCLLAPSCGRYRDFTLPKTGPAEDLVTLRWEASADPVLGRGAPGSWDSTDVLNPAVIRHEGVYYNLYSGYDGAIWHTGLATSRNGIEWERQGRVLSPDPASWEGGYIAANGSVLRWGEEFLYWYQAGEPPRIGLARSSDARVWAKEPQLVLDCGPRGSWDERGVADPCVVAFGGSLYMFHLGQDRARRQRLGVAISEDGKRWWKLRSNPVMEVGASGSFDERGLGEPAVWRAAGRYWMLYTGRDRREHRRIGAATSADGIAWQRLPKETVLEGRQGWNSTVVCDPAVEPAEDEVRVWFGGGDVAHPAENIHGQIGFATLRIGIGKLAK